LLAELVEAAAMWFHLFVVTGQCPVTTDISGFEKSVFFTVILFGLWQFCGPGLKCYNQLHRYTIIRYSSAKIISFLFLLA
jgi:hypothetical protein